MGLLRNPNSDNDQTIVTIHQNQRVLLPASVVSLRACLSKALGYRRIRTIPPLPQKETSNLLLHPSSG
ncbi:hypothetical protein BX666DRAFT_1937987 [Dichotomocladium elegans]|nr:hypothetical protein BX666DRAFT_1937987 [Dichotomocladium elegans]